MSGLKSGESWAFSPVIPSSLMVREPAAGNQAVRRRRWKKLITPIPMTSAPAGSGMRVTPAFAVGGGINGSSVGFSKVVKRLPCWKGVLTNAPWAEETEDAARIPMAREVRAVPRRMEDFMFGCERVRTGSLSNDGRVRLGRMVPKVPETVQTAVGNGPFSSFDPPKSTAGKRAWCVPKRRHKVILLV